MDRRRFVSTLPGLALGLIAASGVAALDKPAVTDAEDMGVHEFDWEIGRWKTHLRRRLHPLTGSNEWVEYEGTTDVRKVWNGRGEFYSQDILDGRAIFVRFIISDITKDAVHFEQAFSDDGGKTWELNWIADDAREMTCIRPMNDMKVDPALTSFHGALARSTRRARLRPGFADSRPC